MEPQKLIEQRQATHGNAWKVYGLAAKALMPQVMTLIVDYPKYLFAWLMILNKLVRASFSPTTIEHWQDIQGYAQLVLNDLEQTNRS